MLLAGIQLAHLCSPRLEPIGVGFEQTFWTNVALDFPDVKLVGCNFHFKQVGKRNMEKHHIPGHEIGYATRFGVYDMLTVIPPEHLENGVEFVLDIIEAHLEHIYKDDAPALKKSKSRWWGFFEKYLSNLNDCELCCHQGFLVG